ncbi:hypothetical protein [Chitinophaga hostae]|uniref:Uncharacterized protein n=1 Tax=Chitinophaga hostae TaxID=2831022 RepID=A0ABS5IVT6_9BACT|nr:hypothetical protein [Chitinophaga hostae]MBS0027069.1 hypothetical protein [Chitinophaga hostae]
MWRIFRRSTRRISVVDAIFECSAGKVEKMQRKYADFLNGKVKSWSPFKIKVVLIVFVLCYISVTAIVLIHAGGSADTVDAHSIYQPTHVIPRIVLESDVKPIFLTDRIKQFRHYLDSLNADKIGRSMYDSIVTARPGLIDSLAQLEKLSK